MASHGSRQSSLHTPVIPLFVLPSVMEHGDAASVLLQTPMHFATQPTRLLLLNANWPPDDWMSVNFPKHRGTVPVRRLVCNHRSLSFVSLPRSSGIVPVRAFSSSRNLVRRVRSPSSSGMVPRRSLELKFNSSKSVNAPKLAGMVPVIPSASQVMVVAVAASNAE